MTLEGLLIEHGGALILPLAVIEGPIVSVVTGFLSARGYFDWYWALCLLVCGDVIGDLIYYSVGRGSGTRLARVFRRFLPSGGVPRELQNGLTRNSAKMLLIGKWTHSIGFLVLICSGMLRLPLRRFFLVNTLASLPKSAVLLGLGYFVGDHYPLFERHVVFTTIMLCAVGITGMLAILRRNGLLWNGRYTP